MADVVLNGVGASGANVTLMGRADMPERIMPVQVWKDIVADASESSVVMKNARHVTMTAKRGRQTLLASLPDAYWLTSGSVDDTDANLKPVGEVPTWTEQYIEAEELAVIVPIPDSIVADADIDIWATIRPMIRESIGLLIDKAAMFGVNKPSTWPTAIIPAAIAAGNVVQHGSEADLGVEIAKLGRRLAKQKFSVGAFVSEPGLQWELVGLRSPNENLPIYTQLTGSPAGGIYGRPLNECTNGAWDDNTAVLAAVDWSKQFIGIRQDITFETFKEGVISDANGKVILNLMQQDTKALRVVMRVGFQTSFPRVTRMTGTNSRYPAAVITPPATFDPGNEQG